MADMNDGWDALRRGRPEPKKEEHMITKQERVSPQSLHGESNLDRFDEKHQVIEALQKELQQLRALLPKVREALEYYSELEGDEFMSETLIQSRQLFAGPRWDLSTKAKEALKLLNATFGETEGEE